MKKNLLVFLFVITFMCVGASVVSAKTPASSETPNSMSKRLLVAKAFSNKIKALKAKCNVAAPCQQQLDNLIAINTIYDDACGPDYPLGCEPSIERSLREAATAYERCLNGELELSKNIDRTMDRKKVEKSRISMSK